MEEKQKTEIENVESNTLLDENDVSPGDLPSGSASFGEGSNTSEKVYEAKTSESTKLGKKLKGWKENVGEKVEGDTMNAEPISSHHNTITIDSAEDFSDNNFTSPDNLIRELQSRYQQKFPKRLSKLLKQIAYINIGERRGATVSDLQSSTVSRDNAEKQIQDARHLGLLVPLSRREGKMKQYALVNYLPKLETTIRNGLKIETLPNDVSLLIANELSKRKYVYHNIHLQTKLNFIEDYEVIKGCILSEKNQQKVATFKLEPRRNGIYLLQ